MAVAYNPRIVTDGLVLALDAANPKSYPGSGITLKNLVPNNQYATAELFGDLSLGNISNGTINISGLTDASANGCAVRGIGNLAETVNADFTTIGWLYRTSSETGEVLSYRYSGQRCAFDIDSDRMWFYQRETVSPFTTRTTSVILTSQLNTWYCYGLVRSGDTWSFYRNGVLIGTTNFTLTETITTPLNYYTIGIAWTDDDYMSRCMDGSIGTILHYTKALTAEQMKQNFNALRGRYGI